MDGHLRDLLPQSWRRDAEFCSGQRSVDGLHLGQVYDMRGRLGDAAFYSRRHHVLEPDLYADQQLGSVQLQLYGQRDLIDQQRGLSTVGNICDRHERRPTFRRCLRRTDECGDRSLERCFHVGHADAAPGGDPRVAGRQRRILRGHGRRRRGAHGGERRGLYGGQQLLDLQPRRLPQTGEHDRGDPVDKRADGAD